MARSRNRFTLALVAWALIGWPSDAHAEPVLVAPQPDEVTAVPYPDAGDGDAVVILVLHVSVSGTITTAEVSNGVEPYASAARSAARAWTFSPATRDGAAVAAKIKFRVRFVDERIPLPEPPNLPPPKPPTSTTIPPPPALDIVEVEIVGLKHPPSVSSLTRAEVRQLPGAFGDPFRAIEILPGVTPIVSGLPFFYVRGAPPGNVGYFLDGVRVPYLFHAAAGPSVVHPGIIKRVDLHAGGYPARYGRYAGAIVAAETTDPSTEWKGEANIRLLDAGALVEGGFANGRGTALVGGRYSYTAGLFSLISPNITLDYRDFQARATFDVTENDRLTLFAFGAYDFLSQTENEIETVIFGSEFYRVDGRYDVRFPDGGFMRAAVTWGFDQTKIVDGRNTQNMLIGTRLRLERPLSEHVQLRGGFDMVVDNYSSAPRPYTDPEDPGAAAFDNLFPPRTDTSPATWADLVWRPNKYFEVTPGIRVDTYLSNGAKAAAPDPRLAVVAKVHPRIRILHALGVANQPPSFIVPVPGLAVASLQGGLQTSLQAASGVEVDLPFKVTATVTAFTSVFMDMTDAIGVGADNLNEIPRSLGSAKGIEVYIRRSLSERLGGFVSYTFSRSTRSVGSATFPAAFDRPHVLHSAFGYNLGGGWQTGMRFSIYSGTPNLTLGSVSPDSLPGDVDPSSPPRDPAFYRIDFRLEKKWKIFDDGWLSFIVEMVNVTLNTETLNGQEVGPITLPSIGVEGGF